MAQPWEQDQVVEAAPWAQDEVIEAPNPRQRIDRAAHPLLAKAEEIDAAAGVRPMLPGVYALMKGTPENVAERKSFARLGDRSQSLVAKAEALDQSPVMAVSLAPMAAPRPVLKPPRMKTLPAAKVLREQGVELTSGQMAGPDTFLGQMEAVSTHNPLGLQAEREAAKQGFMRAAQDKGVAPGAAKPTATDLQPRLGELFKGFEAPYGQIKGKQIPSALLDTLPDAAAMPRKGVDAATAAGVKREVQNALSVLGPEPKAPPPSGLLGPNGQPLPPSPAPPRTATTGDLLKVRENIRESIRTARQSQDFDRLRLLDRAEDVVTDALEGALSPQEAALLRETDKQYARLMVAANAAPAGRTTFTPGQYLRQVEKSAGRRTFKQGGAGDLQDLGEAAQATFQDAPMTGFRGAVMSSVPGLHYAAAPISKLANTPAGKRFLFDPRMRQGRSPEAFIGGAGGTAGLLSPEGEALLRAMRRRAGVGLTPATAEDTEP